mmetsp:Transcript_16535/g.14435  ORF Transcript_16535/g.14435 Transcript_16535/m.14435 type:complete len:142 (+) Transcript_16535:203-628(+)
MPNFETEFVFDNSKPSSRGTSKRSTNDRIFKHRIIKDKYNGNKKYKNLHLMKDELEGIESFNDIDIKFLSAEPILDIDSKDRLNSYLKFKQKLQKSSKVENEVITGLQLPEPKDNQYWKSDLDHKLRCLLRVDQIDYESES